MVILERNEMQFVIRKTYEEGNREAWRALEEAYEAGNKSDG